MNHYGTLVQRMVIKNASLHATDALGLLYFTIQPVVSPYPLATILEIGIRCLVFRRGIMSERTMMRK